MAAGDESPGLRPSFIVSMTKDEAGVLHGMVEAVPTGRTEPFRGLETLGAFIETMFPRDARRR